MMRYILLLCFCSQVSFALRSEAELEAASQRRERFLAALEEQREAQRAKTCMLCENRLPTLAKNTLAGFFSCKDQDHGLLMHKRACVAGIDPKDRLSSCPVCRAPRCDGKEIKVVVEPLEWHEHDFLYEEQEDDSEQDDREHEEIFDAIGDFNWDLVYQKLNDGSDVNMQNKYGETLLFLAVQYSNIDAVKKLILRYTADPSIIATGGPYVGHHPLSLAVFFQDQKITEVLSLLSCVRDMPVNNSLYVDATPLHIAVLLGYQEIAQMLVNAGADMDAEDGEGNVPRVVASRKGFSLVPKPVRSRSVS